VKDVEAVSKEKGAKAWVKRASSLV
jgi:hypothetical protein